MAQTTNDANDLAKLISSQGRALGLDDASSAIIIANMNQGALPMCGGSPFTAAEEDTDDFRLLLFGFDRSISMEPVAGEVVHSVNEIVIPGLMGGAADQVGAIRVGGITFGTVVKPIWMKGGDAGFHALKDLPKLTAAEYTPQGSTALHKGVLYGATALTAYALQIRQRTGSNPECVLAFWSDGANNQAPYDPEDVRKVLTSLSPELFTTVFIGFETNEPVDFKQIAVSLGFQHVRHSKLEPGETEEDMRRRFRNDMGVFSKSLVSRVSKSQIGTPVSATPGAGTGFWAP